MKRLLIIGWVVLLAGCAATRPLPAPQSVLLHTLDLVDPDGEGSIELFKETTFLSRTATTIAYTSRGSATVSDDLGQWRFTYAKTSLNGTLGAQDPKVVGVHGLGVALKSTTAGTIEVDWTRTTLIDGSRRAHPVIHRSVNLYDPSVTMAPSIIPPGAVLEDFVFPSDGITPDITGRADTWAAPAVFERLTPGMNVSVRLSMKSGGQVFSRTFTFAARQRVRQRPNQ